MNTEKGIGIDIGGTSVKGVLLDNSGTILEKAVLSMEDMDGTDASGELYWKTNVKNMVEKLQSSCDQTVDFLGISAPGLISKDNLHTAHMPGRLVELERFDWTNYLQRKTAVRMLNDAHAALYAEMFCGAAKGVQNVIMLTIGTGVGGAVAIEGKLYQGSIGRGGHFGHICLDPDGSLDITNTPGSLEEAIGNVSVKQRSQGKYKTNFELVKAYEQSDVQATEIWLRSIKLLACGLISLINAFDPEAIVIGGGLVNAGESLFGPLRKFMNKIEWQPMGVRIDPVPGRFGEYAGAIGAGLFSFEQSLRIQE